MDNWFYRVSVVLPVYNVIQWLYDCVKSLVNQTISQNQINNLFNNI